jgi:6-phosphogluconolactonase
MPDGKSKALKRLLYIGTYSVRGSKGIYACRADPETGELTLLAEPLFDQPPRNPSYLACRGDWLYAVGEAAGAERTGMVSAYRPAGSPEKLQPAGSAECGIGSPCHVLVFDKGCRLAASHYKTGKLYIIKLNPDGSPGPVESVFHTEGHGPMADRQDGPHIHSALETPDGRELLSADLGLDSIFRFSVQPGQIRPLPPLVCPPGSGPRHMTFSFDGRFLWIIGELDSSVIGFRRDGKTFCQIGHWPILPAGFKGESWAAEIRLHPNGRWLYATNRGADDVVMLSIQPDGTLQVTGRTPTGHWPRGMILSPDGRFLYAASEHGDRIDFFSVDPDTGLLTKRGDLTGIPSPVGFAFAS